MIEVIEHLNNPEKWLLGLTRKLKPGGMIFLSTPEGRSEESETNAFDNPAHIQFFTETSLNLLLNKCGLANLEYIDRSIMYPMAEDRDFLKRLSLILLNAKSMIKSFLTGKRLASLPVEADLDTYAHASNNESDRNRRYHLVGFTKKHQVAR
jgi:2-polyprenyl-3-methyl-5-hydroxy-6-metoxy-1,4-benzoquinol methylase